MTILHRCGTAFLIATLCLSMIACEKESLLLSGDQTKIVWKKSNEGWKTESVDIKVGDEWESVGTPSGEYTFLYSAGKPDTTLTVFKTSTGVVFPESIYKYQKKRLGRSHPPGDIEHSRSTDPLISYKCIFDRKRIAVFN